MPRIDYSKTIIYKVHCKNDAITDFGIFHTTDLVKSRYYYKRDCENLSKGGIYCIIRANGGWDNWQLTVLQTFCDCTCKYDAYIRVLEWCKKLNCNIKPDKVPQTSSFFTQIYSKNPQISSISPQFSSISNTEHFCEHCKKHFARKDNLKRHMNSCKQYKKHLLEKEEHNKKLDEQLRLKEEEIQRMKQQLEVYINTNCKMHPKTLSKINNMMMQQNNNNSYNTNHTNNTINNTINIVELGKENLSEIFTIEQQKHILNRRYKCLDFLIETVHFNNKFKEFQSIAITNAHDTLAYKYVEKERRFVTVNKEDLLEEIVNYRMDDICEFFENCKEEGMDELTVNAVRRFIKEMEDDEKRQEEKIKNIRLIMYNKRNMIKLNKALQM